MLFYNRAKTDEATADHVYDAIADKNPEYEIIKGGDTDRVYSEIKTPPTRAAGPERDLTCTMSKCVAYGPTNKSLGGTEVAGDQISAL